MGKYFILFLLYFLFFTIEPLNAQLKPPAKNVNIIPEKDEENLNVFQQWIRWNNPGSLLINHLIKQAFVYYEIRDREIAKLKSGNDWLKRQESVKGKLMEFIGPFPQKSALNPRITGVIKKEGYRA